MCPLYVVASMSNDENIILNKNHNNTRKNGEKTIIGAVNEKASKLAAMLETKKETTKNTTETNKIPELSKIQEFNSCVLYLPENTLTEEEIQNRKTSQYQNKITNLNYNNYNKENKSEFVQVLQNKLNKLETESVAFYGEKENNIRENKQNINIIKNWNEKIIKEEEKIILKNTKGRIKRGKSPPKYGFYNEFIYSPNHSFSNLSIPNTPANSLFSPSLEEDEKKLRELLLQQLLPSFYKEEQIFFNNDYDDEEAPNATMETKVASGGQPKRVGKWTLSQLRQTDGIIPSQAGWNKGDSQKLMTNFGTPRNTTTKIRAECLADVPEEIALKSHGEVRLQSGTNRFCSQKGMVGFGTGRDVCREGVFVNQDPADLEPLPEEKIRASDGIVRLQSGTNKFDSQKLMTSFGTNRRETTKMKDSKHPEYDHERNMDQSEIPLQSGTNKFASQKGMTSFGTNRRETTKMLDTAHPEYSHESSIDQTSIPYQMGSNRYASQKGMTCFGQPRWEVLDPSISYQNRKSQGMVRLQSGTNRFASQAGMTGFGTPRNTTYEAEAGELPYEDMKKSETIIPSQAGWNKGDSQKLMTGFGTPRDVKGKHLKRIWELEYPEEAEISLDRL